MWRDVIPVPETKFETRNLGDYYNLCPYRRDHGYGRNRILSRNFHRQRDTMRFMSLLITSQKWRISFHASPPVLLSSLLSYTSNASGPCMAYPYIITRIEGVSLRPLTFAICTRIWVSIRDSPPHTIQSPRDRSSRIISGLRHTSISFPLIDRMTGQIICIPWSLLTTTIIIPASA